MARYSVETDKSAQEVIDQAIEYFGPAGVGLQITEQEPCCVRFIGGGGYVSVATIEIEQEKQTAVELEAREWEYHVKRFMQKLNV